MNFEDAEYQVAKQAVKANRQLQVVRYLLTFLAFSFFIFVAYELLLIKADNARLLLAIKNQTTRGINEIKILNEETKRYQTCLLLVPIDQRSKELQQHCAQASDLPGGLHPDEYVPISNASSAVSAPTDESPNQGRVSFDDTSESTSSSQSNPSEQSSQPNIIQRQPPQGIPPQPEPIPEAVRPSVLEVLGSMLNDIVDTTQQRVHDFLKRIAL